MVRKIVSSATLVGTLLFASVSAQAHCPLCTAGAAVAAGLAALLGVKFGAIGVFLGGFATALGLWVSRFVQKQKIPWKNILLFLAVYLSTLLPLVPFTKDYSSWYVLWGGDYGSLFNRTYLINWFIVGAIFGSLGVYFAPRLSVALTQLRGGNTFKFQGVILTFLILSMTAFLMQVLR
jgi:hypothetical protein